MIAPQNTHDDFGGRARDLTMDRRRALRMLAGLGAGTVLLAACGNDTGNAESCGRKTPAEPNGPFTADGSNGPNILAEDGIVRQDIRTSFGGATGIAQGVPLTMTFQVLDTERGCAPYSGAAIYAWHCTADGTYSMYDEPVVDENYLRGVQVADDNGMVTFTTIFPGCYPGRWPHVHFEVYPTLEEALASGYPVMMSQLALPKDTSAEAYGSAGYEVSAENLAPLSIETDVLFSDAGVDNRADDIRRRDAGLEPVSGWADQLATMSGNVDDGYAATLVVRV
jgi:protocatechuate 3,4-dioxygenase beta subunit